MIRVLIKNFIISLIAVISVIAQNQNLNLQEIGNPFLKYYSSKVYKSAPTNWCILQDNRGMMYFGNEEGLLEYDGNSWRKIEMPYSSMVRSIAMDENGRIYLCASLDFGYLEPDSIGQLKFTSLKKNLPEKYKNTGEIWDVNVNSEGVYFKTKDRVFRWDGNEFDVLDSVVSYRFYNINDHIYARNNGVGLVEIQGDSIYVIPGGEYFDSTGVFDMLPFPEENSNSGNKFLITTNYKGLFIIDSGNVSQFKTEADSFLINNQIYNACIMSDGIFAFATQRGGVAIIDSEGKLLKILNENSGLSTNIVYDVYPDKQGGLWLATNDGIVHVELISPFSVLPAEGLLKSSVYSLLRFKDKLYVCNDLGIIYLKDGSSSFKLLKGSNKPAYQLRDINGLLLAATNWGLKIVDNDKFGKELASNTINVIIPSKIFPDLVYFGGRGGVFATQIQKNKPLRVKLLTDKTYDINYIVEDEDSTLWVKSFEQPIIHITSKMNGFEQALTKPIKIVDYKEVDGLPGNKWNIFNVKNRLMLATDIGIYKFNRETHSFVTDSIFGGEFENSSHTISLMIESKKEGYWILADTKEGPQFGKAIMLEDGNYDWKPGSVFQRADLSSIVNIYADYNSLLDKESLWFSNDEGLVHYNPSISKNIDMDYTVLIREVTVTNDSLIYGGGSFKEFEQVIIPFSGNDIRFEFSATSYDKPQANMYQYILDGFNDKWSNWSNEFKKDYTNLSGGSYKFHVRAKNIYGVISDEAVFEFKILPPWYLSWWAYSFYAIIFILVAFISDRQIRRRVIAKERNLAKLRESELIKKQAEELETVDRLVRIINSAEDLDSLFKSLLKQTMSLIPQAEKAEIFLLDNKENLFRVAYTEGYQIQDLEKIKFTPDEINNRYTQTSEEVEKGIYIIDNTNNLAGDEKLSVFGKAKSLLIMAVEPDKITEAYVVFDSYSNKNAFDSSTARLLTRFREHAVSAISKAQAIKILQEKNEEIIRTQEQLVTQQKLASLGALTAGIAHEIKNPLNFVNNFAEVSSEMLDDLADVVNAEKETFKEKKYLEIKEIIKNLKESLMRVNSHGSRADSIVKGMLLHSRGNSGDKAFTDLNSLLDEYLNLAYHGLRALNKEFNITIEKDYDVTIGNVNIVPQDMSRVFLNVINNACYAAYQKKSKNGNDDFNPTIKIKTKNLNEHVEIRIRDNGNGIPKEARDYLFNPFFTTKPSGEGTGLGLSLSYDIITKGHNGELKFKSVEGEFTEFIISLPK